jgi:cation:H+ antiporter
VLFIAGVTTAEVGSALASQTGLGEGFLGATLLAFSSSLPEMTTTIGAVRLGAYALAVSNIFGTNAFLVALLFVADIFYRQEPILQAVDRSAVFIAAIGILTTTVYLLGMIERHNRAIFGMGVDSLIVLIIYPLSVGILFLLH